MTQIPPATTEAGGADSAPLDAPPALWRIESILANLQRLAGTEAGKAVLEDESKQLSEFAARADCPAAIRKQIDAALK
jgi:hypothetical protein